MTTVSNATHPAAGFDARSNTRGFANLTSGQVVNAKVLRKLDEQHYVVSLRGEVREARTDKALPVGESIDVVVVSASDKLQLRRIDQDIASGDQADISIAKFGEKITLLDQAQFYKREIDARELRVLQKAMDASEDSAGMMVSGFFLNKHGIAIEPNLLDQLYSLQKGVPFSTAADIPSATLQEQTTVADLAQSLRHSVDSHFSELVGPAVARQNAQAQNEVVTTASTEPDAQANLIIPSAGSEASDGSMDNQQGDRHLEASAIHQLLNQVDANGLGARYGTLPVLINGELVELELVMFKHQQKEGDVEPIKRLMMSIHTRSMGTISVSAEALNQRLLVNISAPSVEHAETLGAYSQDVKQLAERFGWIVDSVAYEVRPHGVSLARRVMEHSIRQGVIDHVW